MKAFKKWLSIRCQKTIGFLSINAAYRAGVEDGWRACVKWVKNESITEYDDFGDPTGDLIIDGNDLEQELKET